MKKAASKKCKIVFKTMDEYRRFYSVDENIEQIKTDDKFSQLGAQSAMLAVDKAKRACL